MRLLAYRGQSFECVEDVLASMVDYPVPYLGQPLVHGTLFGLLDSDLQPLRLAGAFRIWRRIADGTVWRCIHFEGEGLESQC